LKVLLSLSLIFSCIHVHALDRPAATASGIDSLLPVRSSYHQQNEEITSDLLDAETDYTKTGDNRKALTRLLRILKVKKITRENRAGYRLFNDLSAVSARLKLYPLAMKCYSRAMEYKKVTLTPWYEDHIIITPGLPSTDTEQTSALLDSTAYAGLVNADTPSQTLPPAIYTRKSTPVQGPQIWACFDDGKPASSYAMIVHVKQPISRRRRSFTHINNVGHMFITLIKYNNDNSVVSRSFGFYPLKNNILSGTPLHPGSASVFKDDTLHDWDEAVGKFISYKRFQKIIEVVKYYDHLTYNLNRNNCTDFGLALASIGGITITETKGTWPLGKGNNPGNAGQSMLEGKFRNIDTDCHDPLFVSNNIQAPADH
jgi:hypothetical protein